MQPPPSDQNHSLLGDRLLRLVARAEQEGKTLAQLPLSVLREASGQVGADVREHLGPANVVSRYAPQGAAGPTQLRRQLAFWKRKLS